MGWQGAHGGGFKVLGTAPTALGLSPSNPFPCHAGLEDLQLPWGKANPLGLSSLSPHLLLLSSLPSSFPTPPDFSLGEGGRVLGEVSQVTEQTAPTPPQSPGWRETRFWFLRLHEHTEVHVLP